MRWVSLVLVLVLVGCGSRAVGPLAPSGKILVRKVGASHHIKYVFLIVLENHNWSAIYRSPSAPYINHQLLPRAAYDTEYYNAPGVHPSLPNYLWLEAGTNCFADTGCIRDDAPPSGHATASHAHLAHLLTVVHVSWRAYEQGAPPGGCPTSTAGSYAPKHDPFTYFLDVTQDPRVCATHFRPLTALRPHLRMNDVARYNFITPDLCHDMHNSCAPLNNPVAQGDDFLAALVPVIITSRAYRDAGALFITWDEGKGSDGPIGLILLSPFGKGNGYAAHVRSTHSSLLRTVQEIFGVRPYLGAAAKAHDLRFLFRHFP